MRRDRAAVALGVVLLAAAGCGPAVRTSPPATPAAAPPPQVSAPADVPGVLAVIADEGRVTYSVTLRPGQCRARDAGRLPDPACTPGSIDPKVTQATIRSTICVPGWTKTVRPPAAQTARAKYDVAFPAYGVAAGTPAELDHLVPLELGGSNDISNLWPEPGPVPNVKDAAEDDLRADVCAGEVTLAAAQLAIAHDWERVP